METEVRTASASVVGHRRGARDEQAGLSGELASAEPASGVLERSVAILSAFGQEDQSLSLAELVRRTGLPKTTVHRLLTDLVAVRLLERGPDGRHSVGGRLFELGMRASVERRLLEVAMPFLQDLYERSHQTVHVGVREGHEVVYVAKLGGHRQARSPSRVGGRMPLHCTSLGKVLLAYSGGELIAEVLAAGPRRRTPHTITAPGLLRRQLHAVLENGVAFEREESALGLLCVAAPILDRDDRPVAAVSLTGATGRFQPEKYAGAVRAAAAGISATLARRTELVTE